MKRIIPLFITALLSTSCVSATIDIENVCSSKHIVFGGVPESVSARYGERTLKVSSDPGDMSATLGKISDFATVRLTTVKLVMESESDLTFLHHIKVVIHPTNDPTNEIVLSDAPFTGLDLPLVAIDRDKLLALLNKGSATMDFIGTGTIPTKPTDTTASFCVSATAHGSKSVGDL
jgi:hypothetical protein